MLINSTRNSTTSFYDNSTKKIICTRCNILSVYKYINNVSAFFSKILNFTNVMLFMSIKSHSDRRVIRSV